MARSNKPTSVIPEEKEKEIRKKIINCGLSQTELIETWASASHLESRTTAVELTDQN